MQLKSFLQALAATLLLVNVNAYPTEQLDNICVLCLAIYNTCKETSNVNTWGVCLTDYNNCDAFLKGFC